MHLISAYRHHAFIRSFTSQSCKSCQQSLYVFGMTDILLEVCSVFALWPKHDNRLLSVYVCWVGGWGEGGGWGTECLSFDCSCAVLTATYCVHFNVECLYHYIQPSVVLPCWNLQGSHSTYRLVVVDCHVFHAVYTFFSHFVFIPPYSSFMLLTPYFFVFILNRKPFPVARCTVTASCLRLVDCLANVTPTSPFHPPPR